MSPEFTSAEIVNDTILSRLDRTSPAGWCREAREQLQDRQRDVLNATTTTTPRHNNNDRTPPPEHLQVSLTTAAARWT